VSDPLSPELLKLMEHEKPLEDPTASPVDFWWALGRICRGELYRAAGYETFSDYIAGRWEAA
jgi:hypothetical protein